MANLTVAIDDELLKRARIRALEQGTSVNALLRDYLIAYSGTGRQGRARQEFVDLARQSTAASGTEGRTWTRDDVHNRGS